MVAVFRTRLTTALGGFVAGRRLGELLGVDTSFDDVELGAVGPGPAAACFLGAFLRVEGLETVGMAEIALGGGGGGAAAGGAVGARGDRRETEEGNDGAAGRFGDFMRRSVPPEGDPGRA